MSKQTRNSNREGPGHPAPSNFEFRNCFGFRISDFEFLSRHFREISVAFALLLLLLALVLFAPAFFYPQPLLSRLTREAPALVVACGIALVIICRQIDISIGSQFSVCSVCAGLLAAHGWSLPLVLLASVLIGALLGAFNGIFIAALRLPSIVVTLPTMVILRDGLRWAPQEQ